MRALVVDDDADIRLLLERILTLHGFDVLSAATGPAAIEMLAGDLPDVVLLDIQMPDVDGWDTLRAIRENVPTADLPVVLCTVKASPSDMMRGWRLGCDGYVTKPFDPPALTAELTAVITRTASERTAVRTASLDALEGAAGG